MKPHLKNPPKISKPHQKQLQTLTEDVHKSRIAVQHITKNRQEEYQSSKLVQEIQNQLNYCILQINTEERRQVQKVLKELVGLLKGQMSKMQAKRLEIKQKEQLEMDKKIKQLCDDIDKICSRKNHEVARITELKQSANQRRSQRVVYSNLFKKLEKQLKESQEAYKNQILRSEKNKIDLAMPTEKFKVRGAHHESKNSCVSESSHPTLQQSHIPKISFLSDPNPNPKLQKTLKQQQSSSYTVVLPNQSMLNLRNLEPEQCDPHHQHPQSSRSQIQVSYHSSRSLRQTKQNLSNFQFVTSELIEFSNRIKMQCGVSSVSEIAALMANIETDNEKLQEEIREINEEIYRCEAQARDRGTKNRNVGVEGGMVGDEGFQEFQEEVAMRCSLYGKKNMLEKSRVLKNMNGNQASGQNKNTQEDVLYRQFNQLCSLLQLSSQPIIPTTSTLQTLQKCHKIDTIITHILPNPNHNTKLKPIRAYSQECQRQRSRASQTDKENQELNMILGKMNRFQYCEKFLDRVGFNQEYRKEISRKTKFRSKKH